MTRPSIGLRWAAVLIPGVLLYFLPAPGLTAAQRHLLAVFAATMTHLIVFLPLATMSSVAGRLFKQFSLTVVFATIFSLKKTDGELTIMLFRNMDGIHTKVLSSFDQAVKSFLVGQIEHRHHA